MKFDAIRSAGKNKPCGTYWPALEACASVAGSICVEPSSALCNAEWSTAFLSVSTKSSQRRCVQVRKSQDNSAKTQDGSIEDVAVDVKAKGGIQIRLLFNATNQNDSLA